MRAIVYTGDINHMSELGDVAVMLIEYPMTLPVIDVDDHIVHNDSELEEWANARCAAWEIRDLS